ncbi:30S ribosomal protein S18 [Candidatus Nardonella dryophthoridicola]|nr:30S ribosomal protein S18 [Candidatus Nardonella dryophthoridicola]
MIILDPNKYDYNNSINYYTNIINDFNGIILNIENLGLKKLSYNINKLYNGIYIIFNINILKLNIVKLKNKFSIDNNIIRNLIIKKKINKNTKTLYNMIDYKNVFFLKKFLTENFKILPRKITKLKYKLQKRLSKQIKISRYMSLLPYTDNHYLLKT